MLKSFLYWKGCGFQSCIPLTMNSTAQSDFLAAMLKLYKEGEAIDANVVCQGIKKPVHSAVLVARFLIVVFVRFQDMPPV